MKRTRQDIDGDVATIVALEDGWLYDTSKAITKEAAEGARRIANAILEAGIDAWVYPVPTGGAQVEFTGVEVDGEIELGPDGRVVGEEGKREELDRHLVRPIYIVKEQACRSKPYPVTEPIVVVGRFATWEEAEAFRKTRPTEWMRSWVEVQEDK